MWLQSLKIEQEGKRVMREEGSVIDPGAKNLS